MAQDATSSCCRLATCTATTNNSNSSVETLESAQSSADRYVFHIANLCCSSEEELIRNQLRSCTGIRQLHFDFLHRQLTVTHQGGKREQILAALQAIAMPAIERQSADHHTSAHQEPLFTWQNSLPLALSGTAALAAEALAWSGSDEQSWPIRLLALFAIVSGGQNTLRKGWRALRLLTLNIHFLMSLAVIGAIILGQWPEAAMVIFLFGLAERIEAQSLAKARRAVSELLTLAPEEALLQISPNQWQRTPVKEIQPGAIIRILPGERIPLDGIVTSGHSSVNQAPITGESQPVEKQPGDPLYAGTINQYGALQCQVNADRDHTTLARIIATIQEAQAQRAPMQQFIDRFARYYTPAVVFCALLSALLTPLLSAHTWEFALYNALVLLVVACPCALVLSTPVTLVSGLTAAARQGILIKGGVHLENGYRMQALAIDKTGTLTNGALTLTDLLPLDSLPAAELLRLAAAMESHSEHPLAQAISKAWQEKAAPLPDISHFRALPGKGVTAQIEQQTYYLGTPRWISSLSLDLASCQQAMQQLSAQAKTIVILAHAETPLAIFAFADQLRVHSKETLQQLQQQNIALVLLTGDNQATAQAIAQQTPIQQIHAECLPEHKRQIIQQLLQEHAHVGMVGDGINDAPAMAQATLSFAMGQGTATAMETADVVLMQNDLRKLPLFLRLSRATNRILRQNIFLALFLKGGVFVLALFGLANLWLALFADVGASLLVIANGLRLLRKPQTS
ncbi:heavy metal translocating P-type ATPase [Candidatus Magnetaquicoccus inordinatus]|uniref:heavy metal translocating P-type ATPase n=1 Tax=Candidatus Magnetaquicoccus inordinatus TaxID=2496818 RepID=UPI00102BD2B5|nr:heavy metal translocating P-type ATPase [Candidatus Magnetaquicoccus inordinatus]